MINTGTAAYTYTQCNWIGMRIETLDKGYLTSRRPSWIDEGDVTVSALILGI